jgi:hypothetical protein
VAAPPPLAEIDPLRVAPLVVTDDDEPESVCSVAGVVESRYGPINAMNFEPLLENAKLLADSEIPVGNEASVCLVQL